MFGRLLASTASRRAVKLAAVLGVGVTMLVATHVALADTARPDETPTAQTAAQTDRISIHARVSGGKDTRADPMDMSCYVDVREPVVQGKGLLDSSIFALAKVFCSFDETHEPAQVDRLELTENLVLNGTGVAVQQPPPFRNATSAGTTVQAAPCRAGTWTNTFKLIVGWPRADNVPDSVVSRSKSTEVDLCPGDGKTVPGILGLTRGEATNAIVAAGLAVGNISTVNDCVDPGRVASQNPSGGIVVPNWAKVDFTVATCNGGGPIK